MIKIDLVSGFLGSGKTTFILQLAPELLCRGEKIVIIENEIGEAGIDDQLLAGEGYQVFSLVNGCLCCTLKSNFLEAFIEIKEKIKPDRIILEPSGIFILDSLFDVLKDPLLHGHFELNAILAIIDARHYLRHEASYAEVIFSQVRHAAKLVLSKTESIQDVTLDYLQQSLRKLNQSAEIIFDYQQLPAADLAALLDRDSPERIPPASIRRRSLTSKSAAHITFDTLLLEADGTNTPEGIRAKLAQLASGDFGQVIRAKGFLRSVTGFLEVHYVDGEITVNIKQRALPIRLEIIGVRLDKPRLAQMFLAD